MENTIMYIVLLFHDDNDVSAITLPNGTIRLFKTRGEAESNGRSIEMEYLIVSVPALAGFPW
jgi:hypothetical protein